MKIFHLFSQRLWLQKADSPSPEAIRRALLVHGHEIKEAALIDHTVQVAERALLDAKAPLSYAPAAPGRLVEPCEADPQLESEEPASDGPSPGEDLSYSVSSGR